MWDCSPVRELVVLGSDVCRRDDLNFSHHRTTPTGVSDMISLICRVALHCSNLLLFIGSSTNRVPVAALRFPQTEL